MSVLARLFTSRGWQTSEIATTVVLTAEQVRTLSNEPIVILPAPGPGNAWMVLSTLGVIRDDELTETNLILGTPGIPLWSTALGTLQVTQPGFWVQGYPNSGVEGELDDAPLYVLGDQAAPSFDGTVTLAVAALQVAVA